jgi:O-antigen/teichoic acid export membrane protein
LIKQIISQYYSKLLILPIVFIIQSTIIRELSVDDYAQYSLILSYLVFIIAFSDLGISNYYYREMISVKINYLSEILKFRIVLGFLGFLIFYSLNSLYNYIAIDSLVYIFILTILVITIFADTQEKVLRANSKFVLISHRSILFNILSLVAYLTISFVFGFNLLLALALYIFTIFIRIVFFTTDLKMKNTLLTIDNQKFKRSFFSTAYIPWVLVFILNTIYARLDILMIEYFHDLKEVATYSVAYTIFEKTEVFIFAITAVLYNHFSNKKISTEQFDIFVKLILFIALFYILFSIFFHEFFIELIAGGKYENSKELFLIMSFGMIFKFFSSFFMNILLLEKKEYFAAFAIFVILSANVVLNYLFIPKYGALAATYTTFICDVINFIVIYAYFYKTKSLHIGILTIFSTVYIISLNLIGGSFYSSYKYLIFIFLGYILLQLAYKKDLVLKVLRG